MRERERESVFADYNYKICICVYLLRYLVLQPRLYCGSLSCIHLVFSQIFLKYRYMQSDRVIWYSLFFFAFPVPLWLSHALALKIYLMCHCCVYNCRFSCFNCVFVVCENVCLSAFVRLIAWWCYAEWINQIAIRMHEVFLCFPLIDLLCLDLYLYAPHMIVKRLDLFKKRFTYWIFFFNFVVVWKIEQIIHIERIDSNDWRLFRLQLFFQKWKIYWFTIFGNEYLKEDEKKKTNEIIQC